MRKLRKERILLCAVAAAVIAMTACGNNTDNTATTPSATTVQEQTTTRKEVSLSELHEMVKEIYGEKYIPSMQQDAQMISDLYGVTEDMYEEAIAEGSMISAHVDTFLAFKAKEGQADAIEEKLTAYKEYLLNDTFMYPMNMPRVQAAQIVKEGNYVFFIMLGSVESEENMDEDALLKGFEESNQLAVDAIKEQLQ